MKFTKTELKKSVVFKQWVRMCDVVLIHDTYHDSKDSYATYIVIEKIEGAYTIKRFFKVGSDINVSVDVANVSAEFVFKLLLDKYSRGLK